MALEISEVRPEDYDDISSLWKEVGGDPDWQPVVQGVSQFNSVLSHVVRDKTKLVAMLLCHQDSAHGYGHQMAILEPYRKQGLAKILVDKALQKLRSFGIHKCRLQVSETSNPQPFWEAVKWVDYRRKPDHHLSDAPDQVHAANTQDEPESEHGPADNTSTSADHPAAQQAAAS